MVENGRIVLVRNVGSYGGGRAFRVGAIDGIHAICYVAKTGWLVEGGNDGTVRYLLNNEHAVQGEENKASLSTAVLHGIGPDPSSSP